MLVEYNNVGLRLFIYVNTKRHILFMNKKAKHLDKNVGRITIPISFIKKI